MNSSFTERLRAGQRLLGTIISLPQPAIPEIMAGLGYDWLFLDTEHGVFDSTDLPTMCQAAGQVPVVIRVANHDSARISQALDSGAAGLIVPMVNTAEQARAVIAAAKYPAQGRRGIGLARAHGYGLGFADYLQKANQQTAMILQAEHIDAVNNIESILDVEGIDAILIGPNDLAASMGLTGQFTHPDVLQAMETVRLACQQRRIALGFFGINAEAVKTAMEQGFSLIAVGVDAVFMLNEASRTLKALQALESL